MCVFGREKVYLASLKSGKDCLALKTMGGAGGGCSPGRDEDEGYPGSGQRGTSNTRMASN